MMTEDAKMPSGDFEDFPEPQSVNPARDASIDPPGPVAFAKRRRVPIAIALVVLLALGGFFAFGRSGGPSEEALARDAWLLCFFMSQDRLTSAVMEEAADRVADQPGKYQALVKNFCGVQIRKLDEGWTFAYKPSDDVVKSGFSIFKAVLLDSGCLSDLDIEKLGATRPLDGRVSSTDGRSSWTYSSSTGVSLICSR